MDHFKKFTYELENVKRSGKRPKLLLHSCCAPCSSYASETVSDVFDTTLYFYNPNIYPEQEHNRRRDELKRFLSEYDKDKKLDIIYERYSPIDFANCSFGLENDMERGERCSKCYELRLSKTAEKAHQLGFDYFATTLTISPHKDAIRINSIGDHYSKIYRIKYLHTDFKKKNGFKISLQISEEYNLYRQDYCGCEFSAKSAK